VVNEQPGSNVIKLAGPGVQGREQDPPLFHVDVPKEDVNALVVDPVSFLAERGIGKEQGIAPDGTMDLTLASPNRVWDGRQWLEQSDTPQPRDLCCYTSGSRIICHAHAE
jgi:hypothetical protein